MIARIASLLFCTAAVLFAPGTRDAHGSEPVASESATRRKARAWVERGMALNDNSTSEALCYRRAIESDPAYAVAHFNLAFVFQRQDNLEEALREYEESIRLDPGRADAFYNAGVLAQEVRRNPRETRRFFNRFVELAEGGAKHDSATLERARRVVPQIESEIQTLLRPAFRDFLDAEAIVAILSRPITRGGQTVYEGRRVPLLLYATGRAAIAKGSRAAQQTEELRKALADRRLAPHRYRIEGHADSRGDSLYNMDLSRRRAENVRAWLVGHGISPNRLETAVLGEDSPAYANDSAQHRRFNRRIEITPSE